MTPTTDPIVSSLSKVSLTVTPFIFKNAPVFKSAVSSASWSLCTNIFTLIVSVKSVISKLTMVRSFRISRVSSARTLPRITTSPISPQISSMLILSSSKSRPKMTLGLSERFSALRCILLSLASLPQAMWTAASLLAYRLACRLASLQKTPLHCRQNGC